MLLVVNLELIKVRVVMVHVVVMSCVKVHVPKTQISQPCRQLYWDHQRLLRTGKSEVSDIPSAK